MFIADGNQDRLWQSSTDSEETEDPVRLLPLPDDDYWIDVYHLNTQEMILSNLISKHWLMTVKRHLLQKNYILNSAVTYWALYFLWKGHPTWLYAQTDWTSCSIWQRQLYVHCEQFLCWDESNIWPWYYQ